MAASKTKSALRPVLVTTEHRGVFFGFTADSTGDRIVLERVRNAIYWPAANQGFLGLAAYGPRKGARIGAMAPRIELRGITCVAEITDSEAVRAWEEARWES